MAKKIDIPVDNNIYKVPIEEAMPDNFLPYAVEVAKDRALPDVRDGLKPVHRRILFGTYLLKAYPDKPYYKSARIVGDILGKFHPHGDASVYDAMVILAQDFSTRMPLIDGHGNWGSIDGDNAAAMRYTEARLTPIALELLGDLDKDVVDMVENYSASLFEPQVLPAKYPNILVNGTFGIAVGLATNIPPHNLGEVIDGTLAFIDNPEISTRDLMKYIKGPDLPTGGLLIGKNALEQAYETGEGRAALRAKTTIEKLSSGRIAIVINEFPYKKNKSRILQTISEMTDDKKHVKALESIVDIRDESDRNGIRAVIEMKKAATEEDAEKLLKYLYKKTELQYNLSFNMVAIANGKPETLPLRSILYHYVQHQKEVVTRKTKNELEACLKRHNIVEGFIKAIGIMDEIIRVIRSSKSKKDSEMNLCNEFGFTELQSQAIVELMLYRLTGLEIKSFEKEYKELEKNIKHLKSILSSETMLLNVIKSDLIGVKNKYGDLRRTEIIEDDEEAKIDIEELIIVEDIMVTLSKDGYIKRVPLKNYNRSNPSVEDIDYREGDFNSNLFKSNTISNIMFFTDKGNMYQTKGLFLPDLKWKEKGEKIDSIIKGMDLSKERIIAVHSIDSVTTEKEFMFFTNKGTIKKSNENKFITNYSKLMAIKLKDDEFLMDVKLFDKERERGFIEIYLNNGLNFTLEEPELQDLDRNNQGLQLVNISKNNFIDKVIHTQQYSFKSMVFNIKSDGTINNYDISKYSLEKEFIIQTNSLSRLLVFSSSGKVYNIPAYYFENLTDSLKIESLVDDYDKDSKIIGVFSTADFKENIDVYFVSKNGYVKRSSLLDFSGEYLTSLAYKFKGDNDKLIAVHFNEEEVASDLILLTEKAMCIRFQTAIINPMGRNASGVTGISLSDYDSVIFSAIINSERNKKNMVIISDKASKKEIPIKEIAVQNRAGRGKNIMLVVMDDYIKKINIK